MSATGNGSSEYMATAGTIAGPAGAYSVGFWFRPLAAPNNSAGHNPWGINNVALTYSIDFRWSDPSPTFYKSIAHLQAAGGYCICQFTTVPATGAWSHVLATWDGTTLSLYLNGVLNNTVTGTSPVTGATPNVTMLSYDSGAAAFSADTVGEFTVWNTTLTAAQAAALGSGTLATTIANANILFYSTCNIGDPGQIGPILTNFGATLNHSYFASCDGGMELGGSLMTTATAFGWTMSGGVEIGGTAMLTTAAFGWTMSGGVEFGGSQMMTFSAFNWAMTGGIKLGGTMPVQTTYIVSMTGGIAMGSDAQVFLETSNGAVVLDSGLSLGYTTH